MDSWMDGWVGAWMLGYVHMCINELVVYASVSIIMYTEFKEKGKANEKFFFYHPHIY